MQEHFDTMIFDLDGTLWDSVASVTAAWNDGLKAEADVAGLLSEADIRGIMGLNTKAIGAKLFPYLEEQRQAELMTICVAAEQAWLPKVGGRLYDGVPATLRQLKAKIPLLIVSNCDQGYIEAFLSYHQLADCFLDYLCYGDTGKEKAANIQTLIQRHQLKNCVYIGDTELDRLATAATGIPFMHAAYGFGSVGQKTPAITDFKLLLNFVH